MFQPVFFINRYYYYYMNNKSVEAKKRIDRANKCKKVLKKKDTKGDQRE